MSNNLYRHQERREHDSRLNEFELKLNVTQNVIKNKFEKARKNRLEREQDVNQTLRLPSTASIASSTETMMQPIKNITHGTNNETQNDPNELCVKLRLLMNSSITGKGNHTLEINSIIAKLYELGTLI